MVTWDDEGHEYEAALATVNLHDLVHRLDGHDRTLVMVYVGDAHGACGGDANSGVVMYVTFDGEHFFQLADGAMKPKAEVQVVAGGQPGWYEPPFVVPAALAASALQWFVDHGTLMPEVNWFES